MNARHARITEYVVRHSGDLKPRELRVLLCLLLHRNGRSGRCDPSRKTIGEWLDFERSHVSIAIAGLVSKGWINEGENGFEFADRVVTDLITDDDAGLLPNQQQDVTNLARKVTKSVTALNIGLKQQKQSIEQLSIDAIAQGYGEKFPGKDRRIIEVGILYTLANRNGSNERINSFKYFTPQIEKAEREITEGKDGVILGTGPRLDNFLEYLRSSYDRQKEIHANA